MTSFAQIFFYSDFINIEQCFLKVKEEIGKLMIGFIMF